MEVQIREISCPCGHSYETDRSVNWCPKCGKKIFEFEKDRKAHKRDGVYMYAVIAMVVLTLAYFIFELIISPVLSM